MFGYVRPRKDELKIRDFDAYHAAYCGLCRAMGKRYGLVSRMLVNYDMTFLYLLRSSLRPACSVKKCFCPARVVRRKQCICDDDGFALTAACNVILCYEKLNDAILDSGFFRSVPARIGRAFLRRAYKRASKQQPQFAKLTAEQLAHLHELEKHGSDSIDATADAFAKIVSGCAADYDDPAIRRPMQTVLYQIGRFIYLSDALDDLAKDCRHDRYNPLRFRFQPVDGALCEEDAEYLQELTDTSVNLAGSALSLLPMKSHASLLENIIYLGLPAVFSSVRKGSFKANVHI